MTQTYRKRFAFATQLPQLRAVLRRLPGSYGQFCGVCCGCPVRSISSCPHLPPATWWPLSPAAWGYRTRRRVSKVLNHQPKPADAPSAVLCAGSRRCGAACRGSYRRGDAMSMVTMVMQAGNCGDGRRGGDGLVQQGQERHPRRHHHQTERQGPPLARTNVQFAVTGPRRPIRAGARARSEPCPASRTPDR